MCTCRRDIEARLLDRFKTQAPEATNHDVQLQGYGLAILDTKVVSIPRMSFKTTAQYPLKGGGTKVRSQTSNMLFNYCPFCGEKIEKE